MRLARFFYAVLLAGCGATGGGQGHLPDGFGHGGLDFSTGGGDQDASMNNGGEDLAAAPDDLAMQGPDLYGCTDNDNDGVTTCDGDCDDNDPNIYPGAKQVCNGKDNNCDGLVDDTVDADKDGYSVCMDCNDKDPNVNPGAMEVPNDKVDNNCDGQVDEAPMPCDGALASDSNNALDYAYAMDICPSPFLVGAQFATLADARAHQIAADWGIFKVHAGKNMAALSTGIAADEDDTKPQFDKNNTPQIGTDFGKANIPNPIPMGQNCGGADPNTVQDYTELKLTLKAPTNAKSFSFDFNFLSAEYPEWVCTEFNDKFLAILDSQMTKGNISFDAKGNAVTINNGFFSITAANQLTGTGMEKIDFSGQPYGGATGWLTTTAPVVPGETITLRFIVFDEGDGIYDSQVLIDHFQWSLNPGKVGTGRTDGGTF